MYATVVQANEYVQNYYSSSDSMRLAWEKLSEADKLVSLNRAEQTIDCLPFTGRSVTEDKAFPRYPDTEIPKEVTCATIELAVQTLDAEARDRYEMRRQGVRSYRIGDLSESFSDADVAASGVDAYAYSIVFPFLRDWLGGGYEICPTRTRR